jgi:hypothetical protein
MMDDVSPEPNLPAQDVAMSAWARRNRVAAAAMSGLLVAAALAGELAPGVGLTSTARPYNAFHLVAGVVGFALLVWGPPRGAAAFNFGFGLIDLYQAVAGGLALAPARWFALGPADHAIHVVLGVALVAVALRWRRDRAAQTSVIQPSSSGTRPV